MRHSDTVIVLGSNGMLGHAVTKYFAQSGRYEVIGLNSSHFNVLTDELDVLDSYIKNDTYIINCVGVIKPRIDKYSVEDVFYINGVFPRKLSGLQNLYVDQHGIDIHVFNISTDCVFTGTRGNYTEEDIPDSRDIYGMSKGLGEGTRDGTTIRTSIIGEEINNKYSLIEWAKSQKGNKIFGWNDHLWNGVTTLQLAKNIDNHIEDGPYEGLVNYSGETVSKYQLLQKINDVYNLQLDIKEVFSEQPCNRTLELTQHAFFDEVIVPSLTEQLEELKEFFSDEL